MVLLIATFAGVCKRIFPGPTAEHDAIPAHPECAKISNPKKRSLISYASLLTGPGIGALLF